MLAAAISVVLVFGAPGPDIHLPPNSPLPQMAQSSGAAGADRAPGTTDRQRKRDPASAPTTPDRLKTKQQNNDHVRTPARDRIRVPQDTSAPDLQRNRDRVKDPATHTPAPK